MGIEADNKEIINSIRENAKKLLSENLVDIVIGYSEGTVPLSSTPIIIRKVEDVEKLTWNNLCYMNLARYLAPLMPQLCDADGNALHNYLDEDDVILTFTDGIEKVSFEFEYIQVED